LTAVTQGTATVSIGYDNANRRTSLTLPNGIVTEYSYDSDSQLTDLTYKLGGSTIGTLVYTYDAVGQRSAVEGTYARSNLPAALTSATYDDGNQIATWSGTSFSYDSNGNLTSDGTRTYTWNARNELTGISGPVSASFAYDGFGRRRAKTVTGTTTQFLYDGLNPVQELASGTPTANTLTGLAIDEYFRRIDSSTTRYYLSDALQSSIALTDGSGVLQTSYTYEPFGGLSTSGGGTTNTIGYTGREADGTGLFFNRSRYYDPRLQRFTAEDSLGFAAGSPNLYAYVWNDPTDYVDPDGHLPIAAVVVAIGAVYGGVSHGVRAYNSGGNIVTEVGIGMAAGAFGAGVGLIGGINGNPIFSGAISGATYSAISDYLRFGKTSLPNVIRDGAVGAVLGPLASRLTPKVPGRFPDIWNWRSLSHYFPRLPPKTDQIWRNANLGGFFGMLGDMMTDMFGSLGGRGGKS
jgi:RHS repeat-associated protein